MGGLLRGERMRRGDVGRAGKGGGDPNPSWLLHHHPSTTYCSLPKLRASGNFSLFISFSSFRSRFFYIPTNHVLVQN